MPALQRHLQRQVVVDNRAGAAGAIALQRATTVLDGSEVVLGSDSDAVVAPLFNTELKYTPDQFQVLAVVGVSPIGRFARPGFEGADSWPLFAASGSLVLTRSPSANGEQGHSLVTA